MALTITEAHAVNRLIDSIIGRTSSGVPNDVTVTEARDHAAFLADHANKALMAGWNGVRVRAAWPVESNTWDLLKLTPAVLQVVGILARQGPCRRSNVTDSIAGYVYWQSADWLIQRGWARSRTANTVELTAKGHEMAAGKGLI
jgi:hypothetical protein